jgi:NADPH-dependent curcumin reductase CurA
MKSREWWLRRRPTATPQDSDVELVTVDLPDPGPGEVLVRNLVLTVDPYMRGRMSETRSYVEPYPLDGPMGGRAVGRVVAGALPEGTLVVHDAGWREHSVLPVAQVQPVPDDGLAPSTHLGALGLPGMTAWVGIRRIAQVAEGDVVFVSSAAGAVGSVAVQLAKVAGARVIGSAGGPEKIAWVRDELGADAVFDHRAGPARVQLKAALAELGAPGIDVYFDNVGGEQLEAAIRVLNLHARIALCGMISVYNAAEPVPGPNNLIKLVWRRARMEGFLLSDHEHARPEFEAELVPLLQAGRVRSLETPVPGGIEAVWGAFLGMLESGAPGKTVIPLG